MGAAHHGEQQGRVEDARGRATAVQQQVDALNDQAAELAQLNSNKAELEELASVLASLESSRTGPVAVMDELKQMLNAPADDLQRVVQERRDWDTSWDPRSVWLTSFKEVEGAVSISGNALTNDDVAEFTVRLASSAYFSDVRLERTAATSRSSTGDVFEFDVTARVSYGGTGSE